MSLNPHEYTKVYGGFDLRKVVDRYNYAIVQEVKDDPLSKDLTRLGELEITRLYPFVNLFCYIDNNNANRIPSATHDVSFYVVLGRTPIEMQAMTYDGVDLHVAMALAFQKAKNLLLEYRAIWKRNPKWGVPKDWVIVELMKDGAPEVTHPTILEEEVCVEDQHGDLWISMRKGGYQECIFEFLLNVPRTYRYYLIEPIWRERFQVQRYFGNEGNIHTINHS